MGSCSGIHPKPVIASGLGSSERTKSAETLCALTTVLETTDGQGRAAQQHYLLLVSTLAHVHVCTQGRASWCSQEVAVRGASRFADGPAGLVHCGWGQ